jgi:predicted nucleic acid-binding protein
MRYLLDSGILLRLVNRADALHHQVRGAVRELRRQQHTFVTAAQNIAEFWNVCTRPAAARGGLGLPVQETAHRLRVLERGISILADGPGTYSEWRRLVTVHSVLGVQVHDARVVAIMLTHAVTHLLTLNKADFIRYVDVTPIAPDEIVSTPPASTSP